MADLAPMTGIASVTSFPMTDLNLMGEDLPAAFVKAATAG